jgi:shikimate kinase
MSVVIVGMKGVGKTTAGFQLSQKLGFPFIDSDREIELLYNSSCREIWLKNGEDQFRKIEEKVVLNLKPIKKSVIVLGGGAIESSKVRKYIGTLGIVVCLYMDKKQLRDRWEKKVPFYHRFEEIYQRRIKHISSFSVVWVDATSKHLVEILEGIICGK